MIYIGNFSSWIDPEIIKIILDTNGERRPKPQPGEYEQATVNRWRAAGIDMSKIGWEFYYNEHISKDHIELPIDINSRQYKWWFSKLNPGDMLPMHTDHFESANNVQRFWMACQDHQPGHVFTYDGKFLEGYQAGDMFELSPANIEHGAANLGTVPKISLQILLFD